MPATHSLHLGLDVLDSAHYGETTPLRAAVRDAQDWARLAQNPLGYENRETLLNEAATAEALLTRLHTLADTLQAGDALLLTFAGHGGQIPDDLSPRRGDERKDQTWCLFDRQVLDDELDLALSRFRPGVRISIVADCCHSGTIIKDASASPEQDPAAPGTIQNDLETAGFRARKLSKEHAVRIIDHHRGQYAALLRTLPAERQKILASAQMFAACQDDEVTYDGDTNGIFTDAFKTLFQSNAWRDIQSPEALLEWLRGFFRFPKPNYMLCGEGPAAVAGNFPLVAAPAPARGFGMASGEPELLVPSVPEQTQERYKIKLELPAGGLTAERVAALCPFETGDIQVLPGETEAIVAVPAAGYPSVWEPLHAIAIEADRQRLEVHVEPVALSVALPEAETSSRAVPLQENKTSYLDYWPPAVAIDEEEPPLGWHLDDDHSQLRAARDFVWEKLRNGTLRENIRVGQLDTGWLPWHPAFVDNPNIKRGLTKTFVDKEKGINQAAVDLRYKDGEQQGHGSGTLGVLAGWSMTPQHAFGQSLGYMGAIPFAEVVPIRIADSVLIFDSENFCEGLEYAMKIGCEVVSMSMGGKPSRRMAKMINRAYEKGVTVVCAAGNNMAKGTASIGPRTVVWPARFDRVIAACGACYNHVPYDFEAQERFGQSSGTRTSDLRNMQGNWGPAKAMHKAVAAYSPNIVWVQDDKDMPLRKTGGGTSAATPQVAAAAAMWIALHKDELKRRGYHGTWKQVEAVREALFSTADKSFVESKKYYGNGILRARKALDYPVPDIPDSRMSKEADTSLFGLLEALRLFLDRHRALDMPGPSLQRSLGLELHHLLLDDQEMSGTDKVDENDEAQVLAAIQRAAHCSEALREAIGVVADMDAEEGGF